MNGRNNRENKRETALETMCPADSFWFTKITRKETRQTAYVWRNIQARLCNDCCSGKAI